MIYCDLAIGDTTIWSGIPCLNNVPINNEEYLGFSGTLLFTDAQGASDPEYTHLSTRYLLLYFPALPPAYLVPLQDVPSQSLDIILDGQNCTISIYEKSTR